MENQQNSELDDEANAAEMLIFTELEENSYEISSLRGQQSICDIGRECIALHNVYGIDMTKKGNLFLIEEDRIMYAISNAVVFENMILGTKDYLLSIDDGGIGCVTVHPSRKMFAVGGKGFQPNVYIYSYPDMKVRKVLKGGAEKGYACLTFDASGETLASVSTSPDFMLTIWNWKEEQMGLHSKAFGQDVINVKFSKDDSRRLTTSGTGHIRFWKMASTFTGLKLQGYIGKFGKIDLSDIDNFVEFPDGKVISGTESGSLLLWEGNFIKCRFVQVGGDSCHNGNVTYLDLDRREGCVISAATDGYIRWWEFLDMDAAEVDSDHSMDYELLPMGEYFLGEGCGVKSMIDSGTNGPTRFFVVLDTNGTMHLINFTLNPSKTGQNNEPHDRDIRLCDAVVALKEYLSHESNSNPNNQETPMDQARCIVLEDFYVDRKILSQFHSSAISGMDTCPLDHLVATCSSDGSVRCINYVERVEIANRFFQTGATCLKWLPLSLDPTGQMIAVGFSDGVIRILGLGEGANGKINFLRKMVFKPHNAPVIDLAFSERNKYLATSGKDGTVFLFSCDVLKTDDNVTWEPIRFFTVLPAAPGESVGRNAMSCEKINWSPNDGSLLISCTDGILREVDVSSLGELLQNNSKELATFEESFPIREIQSKLPVLVSNKGTIPMLNGPSSLLMQQSSDNSIIDVKDGIVEEDTKAADVQGSTPMLSHTNTAKTNNTEASGSMQVIPLKTSQAVYTLNRFNDGIVTCASAIQRNFLFECERNNEMPIKELTNGLYSADGKVDFNKNPVTTIIRYTASKKYLISGTSDGSVILRPSGYLETFTRCIAHNGMCDGVTAVATSYDDHYLLSTGKDNLLAVHRLRLDIINEQSITLYKDLDANVFGDEIFKPKKKSTEYKYQSYVAPYMPVQEEELFQLHFEANSEVKVLEQLQHIEEETNDVAAGAYSIQDNLVKLEEDAKVVTAEDLKNRVRASVKVLQKDFEKIIQENDLIPEIARLSMKELLVDGEYFEELKDIGQEMIAEVHRECAYESEKAKKLRTKIQQRLMDGLLMEEITLSAFSFPNASEKRLPKSVVKSFRAKALHKKVIGILNEVSMIVKEKELKNAQFRTNESAHRKALEAVDEMKSRLRDEESGGLKMESSLLMSKPMANGLNPSGSGAIAGALASKTDSNNQVLNESSVSVRRIKRKERKNSISKHLSQKPNEDEDDIRDLNAIRLAERTIGDYKLKCSDDYEVLEEHRINAVKKLRQMAMLEDSMLTMTLQFNERFLALRNLKKQIIYAVRRDNDRIRQIDVELKQTHLSQSLWEPSFDPTEFPEDDDEVTESELEAFIQIRDKVSWDKATPPPLSVVTGMKLDIIKNQKTGRYDVLFKKRDDLDLTKSVVNYFGSSINELVTVDDKSLIQEQLRDPQDMNITPKRMDDKKYYELDDSILLTCMVNSIASTSSPYRNAQSLEVIRFRQLEQSVPILALTKDALNVRMMLNVTNKTQQKLNQERKMKLEFERSMILNKLAENVNIFREAVDDLRVDRNSIVTDLKLAELKMLALFQEYKLLLTFESRDNALQSKQIRCRGEQNEIATAAMENRNKLESKQDEMQIWIEKQSNIFSEFKGMVPDTHAYVEQLTKVFRKKIKRNKGGAEGEDDDEMEEDDEEEGDDNDDDDDDEVEDICPPGCDANLFERILELREKKLDTEEMISELQKGMDELKKTIDRLKQREKQILKESQQTDWEVQQFQLQKQSALNTISICVPLSIGQIYLFETSGAFTGPTDKPIVPESEESPENLQKIQMLRDPEKRSLIQNIDLKSQVLFTNQNLMRLKDRINELHGEINEAKDSLRHLHKERGVLIKERELKMGDIENWRSKCDQLQVLKFGKVIDLDELEASCDRTKELEAEALLKEDEENFKHQALKLAKESAQLQDQLSLITARNTELLNEVANLTDNNLKISRDLNSTSKSMSKTNREDSMKEVEETRRIKSYIHLQGKELESLRMELNMLKRKEAPPLTSIPFLPPQGPMMSSTYQNGSPNKMEDLVLPPIPQASRRPFTEK